MGIFNGGELLRSFMPDKYERRYNSDTLQGEIDKTTKGLDAFRTGQAKTLDDYTAAIGKNIAWREKYAPANEAEINNLIGSEKNYDFLGDRDRARDSDISALNSFLGNLGGGMSKSDKVAASRLGYAGRPSSGYLDRARNAYIGAFASQPLNTIMAGATNTANSAAAARRSNIAQRLGLLDKRAGLMDDMSEMVLNPARARAAMMNDEIGALSGLGGVYKQNLAGWERKVNPWVGAASAVDNSLNSVVDTAVDLVGKVYGGGGMGGMMGGGGGGGMGGGGGIMSMFGKGGGGGGGGGGGSFSNAANQVNYYDPRQYAAYAYTRQQYDPTWNSALYE